MGSDSKDSKLAKDYPKVDKFFKFTDRMMKFRLIRYFIFFLGAISFLIIVMSPSSY